jgi:hypothetical protein
MADFKLLVVGRFLPGQVRVRWTESTRQVLPQVETLIEQAWQKTISTPGVRLFDGRVARLESFATDGYTLDIAISPTSYRIVVGTNFANPQLQDEFGESVMANPLGVSTALLTSDGYWMMGRRNRSVAYYPARVHPFAGSLEVRDHVDIFDDVRRELREELALSAEHITQIIHVGLACDETLRHPESIFFTESRLSREQVTQQLDRDEHDAVWSTPATPEHTAAALSNDDLTPVARASLLLGGRERFGVEWFERNL